MLANPDTIGLLDTLLGENGMSVVAYAPWNVFDRLAGIQQDRQHLTRQHRLKLKLGFDKIIGTNHPTQIQFLICCVADCR